MLNQKNSTEKNNQKEESHINFWVPNDLMEKVKIYAAKSKKSVKTIGIEALKAYIESQDYSI